MTLRQRVRGGWLRGEDSVGRRSLDAHERVDPQPSSPWWGEHRSRYHFAAARARGLEVLDVACGTGYGTTILSDAGAGFVMGVDLSEKALHRARNPAAADAAFCAADATALPLRDASFDVVASFETLEHIEDDIGFVRELRRVLRDDGMLTISTPNALHSRRREGSPNPFHVREYEPDELHALLASVFDAVELLGQRASDAYEINPYWQLPEQLPKGLGGRYKVLSWKVQNRLPYAMKDKLSRILHYRGFYPGEYDFVFDPAAVESAHVIVAVCRPGRDRRR